MLLFLVSCGSDVIYGGPIVKKITDPTFAIHVDIFEDDLGRSVTTPIVFAEIGDTYAGTCRKWKGLAYREININKKQWDVMDYSSREHLIFHELGHCELKRDHKDTMVDLGKTACPSSIMRWFSFNEYEITNCYDYDRNYYLNELFL